ncbi:MAG: M28 family peptidase [Leptolyngbyaceae bacterium]|nr:M28 family peptidase [Leptolyngbyaceae bacterium]
MNLQDRLQHHLTHLVRERDPYFATEGRFYVQQYIREELGQWGHVVSRELTVRRHSYQNLILDLPAHTDSGKGLKAPVLIGAHYDAVVGSPGADDNATGVAVLLELARLFALEPASYPIRLVAFDLEELGCLGSQQYAAELRSQGQTLRLMISLEMLGYCNPSPNSQRYPPGIQYFYPDRGNFIGLIGNFPTLLDLICLSRMMRRSGTPCEWLPAGKRGILVPDTRRSDHAPFWDQGYGAILVTDTAFLRNPNYHKPSDRLETLDLAFLTGVCQGLEAGIRQLW